MTPDFEVHEISNSNGKVELNLYFPTDCRYFAGHFPEMPLLPGVIQAHLAIELFEQFQKQKIHFTGFKNIKFFSPIFPDSWVKLECFLDAVKKQMTFSYSNNGKPFSKGVVTVENGD